MHRRSSACGRKFWWAGTLAAAAGNGLIDGSFPLVTVFSEAVAGGAVPALVTHAMIPEAIEEAGSLIVLPTTAGFLAALFWRSPNIPSDNGSGEGLAWAPHLRAAQGSLR